MYCENKVKKTVKKRKKNNIKKHKKWIQKEQNGTEEVIETVKLHLDVRKMREENDERKFNE